MKNSFCRSLKSVYILFFAGFIIAIIIVCKLVEKNNNVNHLNGNKLQSNLPQESDRKFANYENKIPRKHSEDKNVIKHHTADEWLEDSRFKSLGSDIRIDYFCRQLILSSHPDEALKLLAAESDPVKQGYLINAISDEWSKSDPAACYNWAKNIKNQSHAQAALLTCIYNAAKASNSNLPFELYDQMPEGSTKATVFSGIAETLVNLNRPEAIKRISDLSNIGQIRYASKILAQSYIASNDYVSARDYWETLPYGTHRDLFGEAMVSSLIKKDPALGLDWVKKNLEEGESKNLIDLVATGYANSSPEMGLKQAAEDLSPEEFSRFAKNLGTSWGATNPDEASRYLINCLSTTDYQNNASLLRGIVSGVVQSNHAAAFGLIDHIESEAARNEAAKVAVQTLSVVDAKAASEYLGKLPENLLPNSADLFGSVAKSWLSHDPMAASKWISGLPTGAGRDSAVVSLVNNIMEVDKNYSLAASWTNQINDSRIRESVLLRIQNANKNVQK